VSAAPHPALTDDQDPVRAVEIAAARAWPATLTAGHAGWLLRATAGVDRARSNSALPPPAGPARPHDLDAVIAWLRAHTSRPRIMVSPIERHAALDAELERRGWTVQWDVDVLVAPLEAAGGDAARPGPPVGLRSGPDPAWLAAWAACEDRALAGVQAEAEHILAPLGARAAYALAGRDADPAGVGIGVTVGSWCGIFGMATRPSARRCGVGAAVLRSLASEGRRRGAVAAYLQVVTSNAAAQALYARHGFRRSHGYRTRVAPAAASGSGSPSPPSAPSSS
jgi:ribosomal protein S18 acetylase RimI-like enzyme